MAFYLPFANAFLLGFTFHLFYEAFMRIQRGLESRRNFREWAIDEVCVQRRYAVKQKKREKLYSLSKAIESKAWAIVREEPLEPLQQRPYGLPLGWNESGWEHIWRCVLEFIKDPKDVINLSETCMIFRHVLRRKYKAAKLAEVYKVCLVNATERVQPTKDLIPLRLICKTTQISVDEQLMRSDLHNIDYFRNPSYIGPDRLFFEFFDFPLNFDEELLERDQLLSDFVAGVRRQARVPQFVTAMQNVPIQRTLPVKDIVLSEIGVHDIDIPGLQDDFERLFGLVGGSVHSFFYNTEQSGYDTYNVLRRHVPLLPNLQRLRVSRRGQPNEIFQGHIEPFPVAPKLRSFREMHSGFPLEFLIEVLRATPAMEHIDLCHFPKNRLAAIASGGLLDQLPLKTFNCGQIIPVSFLQRQFNWPLRTIVFEGTPYFSIPCDTLVNFVNSFGTTLQELVVPTFPRGTGGMLRLPNLTRLMWFLQKEVETLEFMNPLQSLEKLDMFVYYQTGRMSSTKEKILAFLKRNNVPRLFPAMRRIKVVMLWGEQEGEMGKVWEMGDDV